MSKPVRERASAASHALSRLEFLANELVFDGAFALVTLGPGNGAEAVDANVALFALRLLVASEGVVGLANLLDVRPTVVVNAVLFSVVGVVLGWFLGFSFGGGLCRCFFFLDFLWEKFG